MTILEIFPSWLAMFGLVAAIASGVDFSGQRVTKVDPTKTNSCIDPPSASLFITTVDTVYLYFNASVSSADLISADWLSPDGTAISGGSWPHVSGNFCFTGPSLAIRGLPPSRLGAWQARVYNNGTPFFTVSFAVNGPGGSTYSGPGATTSQRTLTVDLNIDAYYARGGNRFDQNDGWQCTRYAWGRALEKTGAQIHFTNENLGGLDGGAWYGRVIGLSKGTTARPNSIAVWSDSGAGHVAFVEDVNNGNVTLSEANYYSYPNANYDGLNTISLADMARRSNLTLVGYIYLTGYEGYVDVNSDTCTNFISGWIADRNRPNASLNVDFFEGENFLGSTFANTIRSDVGNYLNDSGDHGFAFALPNSLKDNGLHTIWARVSGTYADATNTQPIRCGSGVQSHANLVISVSSLYSSSDCYYFTLNAVETAGVGVNLSTLNIAPENFSYPLPNSNLGMGGRIDAFGTMSTPLKWCRSSGASTFSLIGTDDRGNGGNWANQIIFP